jgi:hypothetical protein
MGYRIERSSMRFSLVNEHPAMTTAMKDRFPTIWA